jgi:DNA-binding response OmpR family regulator
VAGLTAGGDDYVTKPFSLEEVIARLRALMRRGGASQPVTLATGEVELDVARRRCHVAGDEVKLTAREFSILEYLLRRRGEVVPKREIVEHVWDFAYDGEDNVVEVHVSALRRKLGPEVIETIRGGGYRVG